jgi:hypothetical protein
VIGKLVSTIKCFVTQVALMLRCLAAFESLVPLEVFDPLVALAALAAKEVLVF